MDIQANILELKKSLADARDIFENVYGIPRGCVDFDKPYADEDYNSPNRELVASGCMYMLFRPQHPDTYILCAYVYAHFKRYATPEEIVDKIFDNLERKLNLTADKYTYMSNNSPVDIENPKNVLNKFFDMEHFVHPQGGYLLTKYRNKHTQSEGYFGFRKHANGWIPVSTKTRVFASMFGANISKLNYVHTSEYAPVSVDYFGGIVSLPSGSADHGFCMSEIVKAEDTKLDVLYTKITVVFSNQEPYLSKTRILHKFKISSKGTVVKSTEELDLPDWMGSIADKYDLTKNPCNADAHKHMPSWDKPLYHSDDAFVTSKQRVYACVDGVWLMTDERYLISHLNTLDPESEAYDLLSKTLCTLGVIV